MHLPPPPDARTLLPPLLACLPTAFISLRPPPALLPLLSPVLRQRLSFLLSTSTSTSQTDSWLPLLSWDSHSAEKLPALVERMQLEPHPVSGELELEDVRPAKYRRLDEETLHARLEVEEFEIGAVYVWCEDEGSLELVDLQQSEGGTSGQQGPGWKLADLKPLEDILSETSREKGEWHDSIASANAAAPPTPSAQQNLLSVPDDPGTLRNGSYRSSPGLGSEDDYWAAYDRTPGPEQQSPQHTTRTAPSTARQGVGRQRSQSQLEYFARYGADSPAPSLPALQPLTAFNRSQGRQRAQSEFDYFSRYGSEVQPALDPEDPDEAAQFPAAANSRGAAAVGEYKNDWRIPTSGLSLSTSHDSVMHSHSHSHEYLQPQPQRDPLPRADSRPTGASLYPADPPSSTTETTKFPSLDPNSRSEESRRISAPRAISPTKSSSQDSIENLERRARAISEAEAEASQSHLQHQAQTRTQDQNPHHDPDLDPCDLAQTAIKAHISTDIKSLFRLARKTGIEREDFERIVRTELEFLGMLEQEG